jgi:hypothetical protein
MMELMMGMKPRKKPKRKRTYAELEEAVQALGSCTVWALKFMKPRGSGEGLVANTKTGETRVWTEKFMDALDKIGYVVDREAYYASMDKKRKR